MVRGRITHESTVWCGCACDCQEWDQDSFIRPTATWRKGGWTTRMIDDLQVWHCPRCSEGLCDGGT